MYQNVVLRGCGFDEAKDGSGHARVLEGGAISGVG